MTAIYGNRYIFRVHLSILILRFTNIGSIPPFFMMTTITCGSALFSNIFITFRVTLFIMTYGTRNISSSTNLAGLIHHMIYIHMQITTRNDSARVRCIYCIYFTSTIIFIFSPAIMVCTIYGKLKVFR